MAVPAAGMITSVTFLGSANGQRIMNTVHYRMTVAWTAATIQEYYDFFHNQIKPGAIYDLVTSYLAFHSVEWTLDDIRLQVVYPTRYRARLFHYGSVGIQTGHCDTQNSSVSVVKRVEEAGRSKVGRISIGGMPANAFAFGFIPGGFRIQITTWTDALSVAVFNTGGLGENTPCLYHPKPNANPKYDLITGMAVQDTARTQRTRTIGKGE